MSDGDLEQPGLDAQQLVDDARSHGGDEGGDLSRMVPGALAESRFDAERVAVERLALRLHELDENGPDMVHGGSGAYGS